MSQTISEIRPAAAAAGGLSGVTRSCLVALCKSVGYGPCSSWDWCCGWCGMPVVFSAVETKPCSSANHPPRLPRAARTAGRLAGRPPLFLTPSRAWSSCWGSRSTRCGDSFLCATHEPAGILRYVAGNGRRGMAPRGGRGCSRWVIRWSDTARPATVADLLLGLVMLGLTIEWLRQPGQSRAGCGGGGLGGASRRDSPIRPCSWAAASASWWPTSSDRPGPRLAGRGWSST